MIKLFIFFFPALTSVVLGLTLFVASVRLVESGAGAIAVTTVSAAWAASYMVFSHWVGRMIRPTNSAQLIIIGCAILAVSSLAFIMIPTLGATYPIIILFALGSALFFSPFQVFMKSVDQGDVAALPRSIGLYTFAWSTGMAIGPFVSVVIWNFGWQLCYVLSIALSVMTAAGVFFLRYHAQEGRVTTETSSINTSESKCSLPAIDYTRMPDLAWLGWLCSGIGCLTAAVLRSYLPSSASVMGIPREGQGKSGGFRTIYIFGGTHMPIFLVTVFAKKRPA